MPVHDLKAADLVLGSANKPKRQRKPRIDTIIKQAERYTGKQVTSITTPDGVTLTFGKPEPEKIKNEWDTIQ